MPDFPLPGLSSRSSHSPSMLARRVFARSATAGAMAMALATALATACGDKPTATVRESAASAYEQVVYGPVGVMTTNGVSRGTIRADSAFTFAGGERFELHTLTATIRDSAGADSTTVTARTGTYETAASKLIVRGGVRVTAPGGRRLEAESLHYDLAANAFRSSGPYTLSGSSVRKPEGVLVIDPLLRRAVKPTAAKPAAPVAPAKR